MELCCDEASGRPLYFSHVRLAAKSTGDALPDAMFSSISKAYIYLTASYYVADSLIDGHLAIAPTQLPEIWRSFFKR